MGELGFELYIPSEQAVHVYDRVVEAGKGFGLRHVGLKVLNSLHMEKGYRDYGHDMDNTDYPYEIGLGSLVKLNKVDDFIGKDPCSMLKQADDRRKRFAQVRRYLQFWL